MTKMVVSAWGCVRFAWEHFQEIIVVAATGGIYVTGHGRGFRWRRPPDWFLDGRMLEMAVFGVILKEGNSEVWKRLEAAYPEPAHFKLSRNFAIVTSEEVTQQVAEKVGIKGDTQVEDVSGVVFKLTSSHSGYTDRGLWEWIADHRGDFS
ncbi:MAG: hypothetical protein F4145_05635 [Boseongicola sp. SB0675_bin_26]|nr:hypothetical protein [Boseongicola sp. SB0675_bin_26]